MTSLAKRLSVWFPMTVISSLLSFTGMEAYPRIEAYPVMR